MCKRVLLFAQQGLSNTDIGRRLLSDPRSASVILKRHAEGGPLSLQPPGKSRQTRYSGEDETEEAEALLYSYLREDDTLFLCELELLLDQDNDCCFPLSTIWSALECVHDTEHRMS